MCGVDLAVKVAVFERGTYRNSVAIRRKTERVAKLITAIRLPGDGAFGIRCFEVGSVSIPRADVVAREYIDCSRAGREVVRGTCRTRAIAAFNESSEQASAARRGLDCMVEWKTCSARLLLLPCRVILTCIGLLTCYEFVAAWARSGTSPFCAPRAAKAEIAVIVS